MTKIIKYTVLNNTSIGNAIKKINELETKAIIVLDHKTKNIVGTLSDGDLRRAFLKGKKITQNIRGIYTENFFYFSKIPKDKKEIQKIFEKKRFQFIPVINKKKLINIIFPFKKDKDFKKIHSPVLIMAGGLGSRLKPFTEVLPKPLIPINNKTAISTIIDKFSKYNIKNFFISVNFKKEILESYLSYINKKKKYKFSFLKESRPLGTAGPIKLLENKIKNNFFLVNCDVIFDFNLNNLENIHKRDQNILTIVVTSKNYKIPYGVCFSDDGKRLKNFQEKIINEYNINIGFYVINKKIFKFLKKNVRMEFDELINILLKKKQRIGLYFIESSNWKDVGQWDDYNNLINEKNN